MIEKNETTVDPRLFEAGVRLGTMVDLDYLTLWAEMKLPKLLADNPGATAESIVDLALEQIPAKFRTEVDTREAKLYDRIRTEVRARSDEKKHVTAEREEKAKEMARRAQNRRNASKGSPSKSAKRGT